MVRLARSRLLAARGLVVGGCAAVSAGAWLLAGLGVALVVAGSAAIWYGLMLVDVDGPEAR